jgi:hypothetical protein
MLYYYRDSKQVVLGIGNLHRLAALMMGVALMMTEPKGYPGSLVEAYTDPSYQTGIWFGLHSHWVQPWRGYLETMPATLFLNGLGVGYNGNNPDLVMEHLARHGIKLTRIEVGWGNLTYQYETFHTDALFATLRACKKWGIRPIILLNAHQGVPCPALYFQRVVTADAPAGSTTLQLNYTSGLVIGKSGLSNLTDYWAAEALITRIDGNTVTLSKPLPKALAANATVDLATLKYRPFSPPRTQDYADTLTGWQRYVKTVNQFASFILGRGGFDFEIWNELTFGSEFLYINHYYATPVYDYGSAEESDIHARLPQATADVMKQNSAAFRGVEVCDGFSNTIPWPSSTDLDPRIGALSKHAYPRFLDYPSADPGNNSLNAELQVEQQGGWVPTYHVSFPEYSGTALQTEHELRDASPITTDIYGNKRGRFARVIKGEVVPCTEWMTEAGYAPAEDGISDPKTALAIKAKTTARFFCFFLNKGIEKLTLYASQDRDIGFGIVQDNFNAYTASHSVYPADDALYTSPALRVTKRIVDKMSQSLDKNLISTRSLQVTLVSDTHDHSQFDGDGTAAHPPLYDREVLAILPFQVNASRFVVPYYVMTRDVRKDLVPEQFTIGLKGFNAAIARVQAYDPINDQMVPVMVKARSNGILTFTVTAADYPYLLIINE